MSWIQSRLKEVTEERGKVVSDKKMGNTKLAKNKVCHVTIIEVS